MVLIKSDIVCPSGNLHTRSGNGRLVLYNALHGAKSCWSLGLCSLLGRKASEVDPSYLTD